MKLTKVYIARQLRSNKARLALSHATDLAYSTYLIQIINMLTLLLTVKD